MTVVNYSIQDTMGGEQFLLERRRLVSRSPEPEHRDRRRASTTRSFRTLAFSLVCLLIEVPLGIAIALCIPRRRVAGWRSTLVVVALPMLIPWNVVGTIWQIFTRADIGLFGAALTGLGLHYNVTQDFDFRLDHDRRHRRLALDAACHSLSYAGLRAIPDAFYQAAQIDGAAAGRCSSTSNCRSCRRCSSSRCCCASCRRFMIYTEPFVVTGGGPGSATTFLSIDLVKIALGQVDLGNAAAMSLVYYLITLTVCWVFFTIMTQLERRRDA